MAQKGTTSREPEDGTESAEGKPASVSRVTVDDVEYVYQGIVRNGNIVRVTVLATSRKGERNGPNGAMTIIDDEGEKYTGYPVGGFGALPELKEDVPLKLSWQFGGNNAFTGAKLAPPPSVKVKRFASVSIQPTVGGGGNSIDFRNVTPTQKGK